jgi:transposase
LKGQGFKGSLRVVAEWATRRRRAETVSDQQLRKVPAAKTIARLMTMKRDHLTKGETVTVTAIEKAVPTLADARILIDRFQAMIRKADAIVANGVAHDKSAVHAAITQPWSNGQVEAQITKLKLVKRQMYGRAKLDLLQARLIGAP